MTEIIFGELKMSVRIGGNAWGKTIRIEESHPKDVLRLEVQTLYHGLLLILAEQGLIEEDGVLYPSGKPELRREIEREREKCIRDGQSA